MDSIDSIRLFCEDEQNHEKCDLTDLVFKDLDYRKISQSISFFRSDFSRSRFYNCTFSKNAFGRADFIDVYMENTEFDSVDFGSCLIKNALFEKIQFKKNSYRGVAIQYSYFKNCVFRDEHFVTNMYHCDFYECTFINCTFEKSSLDSNTFTKCEFIKVDMSECIADGLRFDSCALRDVYLCANLWMGYLYKDTDIYNFGFKYRGKVVDPWEGNPTDFIISLLHKRLYFEYVNTIIVGQLSVPLGLVQEVQQIIPIIISQTAQMRKSTLIKILDMLLFYRNNNKLIFGDYIALYSFLVNYDWSGIPFEEQLIYQSKLYKIRTAIEYFNFSLSYIKTIEQTSICIAKFHINTDSKDAALAYLERLFDVANQDLCENAFTRPLIRVLQVEEGSIILTIASVAVLTLLISSVAKKVMHNLSGIQIEQQIKKNIIKQLSQSEASISDIQKSCALAQKYNLLPSESDVKQIERLSSELAKGEILDVILSFLT